MPDKPHYRVDVLANLGGRDPIEPLRTPQLTHGTNVSPSFFPNPHSCISGDLTTSPCWLRFPYPVTVTESGITVPPISTSQSTALLLEWQTETDTGKFEILKFSKNNMEFHVFQPSRQVFPLGFSSGTCRSQMGICDLTCCEPLML